MASSHRHQSSLEDVIDFSGLPDLSQDQRTDGERRLYQIVAHFQALPDSDKPYSRPLLIRCTYDWARSRQSKDDVLRVFFDSVHIPMVGNSTIDFDALEGDFNKFAQDLLDGLYIPLKAAGSKTVQPTPEVDSALSKLRHGHIEVGTPDRLKTLRAICLERDRHRCVISRAFDSTEYKKRWKRDQLAACDDDGVKFTDQKLPIAALQVAHILPHTLTKAESESNPELAASKKTALNLLNMFDHGVTALIDGVDIDHPRNAITLATELHNYFGSFELYFEPQPNAQPGQTTYQIRHFLGPAIALQHNLPITRTLFNHESIDPPLPRLLMLHRAIAHVLHLSGAGEYIQKMLWDLDEYSVHVDGSTPLDQIVKMRLGGWWDGTVRG